MNFDPDEVLFGLDPSDPFNCASPINDGQQPYDYRTTDYNEALVEDLHGFDNSLAVPMDDYQFANDNQNDSRDFQTLQPPVTSGYDMDLAHSSQSSMGMGGYSNGGTTEGMLYEQTTTITNGDHHMMGVASGEEHYGMPSTSYGSYHASPLPTDSQHPSPSVSRQTSRPASRTTIQKGGGQHMATPSTSNYNSTPQPAPPPPPAPKPSAKKNAARTAANGRKKANQGVNSVGAVLAKANKAGPAASTSSIRLTADEMQKMARLATEIEQLEKQATPHSLARARELTEQRAQILMNALIGQQPAVAALTPVQPAPAPRPKTSHKKQAPPPPPPASSSPGYTPQCAVQYTTTAGPSGVCLDGYGTGPGTGHASYTATPTAPMQQRGGHMYKSHHAHHPQQQHRSSPMPSTSSAPPHHQQHHQQPQPQSLLQLSQPVQHHQPMQQMRMEENNPFRRDPALIARRVAEKQAARQRKLQNAFDIMSKQLLEPETEVPFSGVDDVFRRLMPYHLLFEHDMDPQLEEEFDLQYMRSMVEADEKKRRLTERMRRIAINEAVSKKDEECNLLLFLDAEWERNKLEEERKMAKEDNESLRPVVNATARSLLSLPTPSKRLAELKAPPGVVPLGQSLYDYHPFVERRRIPTPPPPGPLHGLEESEVEEDTEEEEEEEKPAATAGPSHTGKSYASAHALLPSSIKREPSPDDSDSVSPEMGWPVEDLPKPTVPLAARPTVTIKQEVASPRSTVPTRTVFKQEVASPARNKTTVTPSGYGSNIKHEMPEAIPVPLAKRNRLMEDRMREEERRKKVEEREKREAEERRRREDERKDRERKKKEEEAAARIEEERRKRKEEAREREEAERRKKEVEEEPKRIIMPLKLKIKMAARAEDERKEEEKKEEVRKEEEKREEEEREKKSKKKRKKEKRRAEGDDEDERDRKRRKKERKERERLQQQQQQPAVEPIVLPVPPVVAVPAAAAASSMTTPIPKLKIKFGGGGGGVTPAATPSAAAAMSTPRPAQPSTTTIKRETTTMTPTAARSLAPPIVTPVVPPVTPVQQQPAAAAAPQPQSVPRITMKFSLTGLKVATASPTPSPVKEKEKEKDRSSKEERKRERKEEKRRMENGHHEKERHHHHKHKEHNSHHHKEHKSERRHKEQHQQQQQPVAAVAPVVQPRLSATGAPPSAPVPKLTVPSVKINMAPRPQQQPPAAPRAPAVAAPSLPKQQQQPRQQQMMQQPPPMAMSAHKLPPQQPPPSLPQLHQQQQLFRPSVISAPPSLPVSQLTPSSASVTPTLIPPLFLGLNRLPPGPEEKSPERVEFTDSEDEDDARSQSLHQSAAAITRMVGHAPTLQPHHHLPHRLPHPLQPMQPAAAPSSFPWNNQYQ